MAVPNLFATQAGPIPLAQLDADFASFQLGTGASLLGYQSALTGSVATTQAEVDSRLVSITDFGAISSASSVSSNVTTATIGAREVYFPAGIWNLTTTPTINGNTQLVAIPGAAVSGSGAAALGFTGAGHQRIQFNTTGGDFATQYIRRNANHTGGTAGFVSSALKVETYVTTAGATNFEWALTAKLDNSATAGQNVGAYLQGIKRATGPTWAGVSEAIDATSTADPATGLVGHEVDIRANGTDANKQRVGVDVVATRQIVSGAPSGAAMVAAFGFRTQNSGDASSSFVAAFAHVGNAVVGLDISGGTVTQAAIKVAAAQSIAFDAAATNQVNYDGTGIAYKVGGTLVNRLNADGSLLLNVSGSSLKVFGTGSSGAATPTLSANKPGSNGGVTTWLSVTLNGTQLWIPAFAN